jgi:hypothetical protein
MKAQLKTTLLAKGSSITTHEEKKSGRSFSGTSSRGLVCIIKVRLRKQLIITVPRGLHISFSPTSATSWNCSLSHTLAPMNSIRQVQALNKRELEHAM